MYRLRSLLLLSLFVLGAIAVIAPDHALAARNFQDSAEIQLSVQPFFDGRFRLGSWLPLRVTVANSGPDLNAVISMAAPTGPGFETPIDLPRGANKTLVLYTQPTDTFRRTATVHVLVDRKSIKQTEIKLNPYPITTQIIGVLSAQPLTLPLPRGNAQTQKIETLGITPADLPGRAEGLSLFDVILIDGAPLANATSEQQQALADWVRLGGQLVIGGTQLETTLSQLPELLRIATPGPGRPDGPISILPELNGPVPDTREVVAATGAYRIATAGNTTVGVQRDLGAGRVTMLGFSLSAAELGSITAKTPAWTQLLRLRTDAPEQWGMQPPAQMQAQQLGFALTTLPVLARPPLGLLVGLLGAYILIIGPGLYFLLRRLDRQAWGWVAIPLITVLFALGAYGYGLQMRGDDIILNQINIVEPSAGRSHVRTYSGIFSPRTTTYQVRAEGDPLFKAMSGGDWGPMPAQTVGGNFVQGSSGVRDLNIAQWSMNTFAAEQMIDGEALQAELVLAGDVLRGTVRNTGSVLLRDVALFQGTRILKIGELGPGASKEVELSMETAAPGNMGVSLSMLLLNDQWDFNKPAVAPAEIRMKQSILDAMFSSPYARGAQPTVIGWLDQSPLELTVEQGRVKRQQTSLVIVPATVSYATNTAISLPRGWITPNMEVSMVNGGGPCMSQFGSGWYLDTGVMTSTLQLPPALQSLTVDEATVFVQTDGPLPPNMNVDLYDWASGEWIAQPEATTAIPISEPERFVGDNAAVKVRINLQNAMQSGGGCLTTDLSVKGHEQ